ncbi:MAG TPA: tRNA pseudouridine(38-40) synthase TruA [Anaerolineae bacterium]|nr:tRNA pseudouridine(38-40) synthase TruA [Anaerolineae bacterium]
MTTAGQRFRATVEYDGSAYQGFQRQAAGIPTIQERLEASVKRIAGREVTVIGAGRTDSGVHATGQVVSFSFNWTHSAADLQRAINAYLPTDIAVLQVTAVAADFHPRFDARWRAYRYTIYNGKQRRPLKARYSWHVAHPLDVEVMNEAAKCLVGTHDFATFGQPPQGTNTVRELFEANWSQKDETLFFEVRANAFLYRMVRSLVGSLKAVGCGQWRVDEFEAAFRAAARQRAAATAPPEGLVLTAVGYDDKEDN